MKYFLHDSNALSDEKLTELYMNFGYEGIGLFYTILEKLSFQEKPVKTIVLKRQLNVKKRLEKCWSFMEEIGIISSTNGETFNENILKFSENYQIKKEKTRKKISEWREKQQDKKNVTSNVPICNAPKVKLSKVKISNNDINIIVSYLNEKAKKQFKSNASKTVSLIKVRMKEGFTIEDFKKVIDLKCEKWLHDPKMNPYLRPETLFGNKFEGYLNEKSTSERQVPI